MWWSNDENFGLKVCFHFTSIKSLYFLLMCWVGVHSGINKSSYNISNISYLNSPLPPLFFIAPPPIPQIVSTGLIFQFTCICTQYLDYIYPLTPFSHLLPPLPTGTNSLRQDLFHPSILWVCKVKNDIFVCLR
jgi:hypothetical protein